MAKVRRLNKITREFNVGIATIVEYLNKKGHEVAENPNTKISDDQYDLLVREFSSEKKAKTESSKVDLTAVRNKKKTVSIDPAEEKKEAVSKNEEPVLEHEKPELSVKVVGKIDLSKPSSSEKDKPAEEKEEPKVETKSDPVAKSEEPKEEAAKPEEKVVDEPKAEKEVAPKEEPKPAEPVKAEEAKSEVKPAEKEPEVKAEAVEKTEKAPVEKPVVKPKAEPKPEKPVAEKEPVVEEKKEEPVAEVKKEEAVVEVKKEEPVSEEKKAETPSDEKSETAETTEGEKKAVDGTIGHLQKIENNVKVVGKIDLDSLNQKTRPDRKSKAQKEKERKERIKTQKPGTGSADASDKPKRKRKRIRKDKVNIDQVKPDANRPKTSDNNNDDRRNKKRKGKKVVRKEAVSEVDVQKQMKETLARLTNKSKSKSVKYRREKRDAQSNRRSEELEKQELEEKVLKVTEFVSVSEIASMMDIQPTQVISSCMSLGLFVSINQRLDAQTIELIASEFGYEVEFVTVDLQESIEQEDDKEEDLISRPPIVTVMGHVDHGKTSLLDYIRKANVIAGEAGGITQHIGAYSVSLDDGRRITFLDTPGHEAFTAMRARGAQVTDIAVIVVAADDNVMPQTKEAINHASAAGVPIVFAINKIDKPAANPDKIKEELSTMNYLVEDWGGKYQSQDISAKQGINIRELLDKVLLEAELLELKANPEKRAVGTVIESELDRGRGYVSTILVEAGTLKVGDFVLAGHYHGRVKALYNERNQAVTEAGPAAPVIVLGLNGAPQAGDRINVMADEREAKDIANKREQLQREQELKTKKHITLDEIGRRIAIGNFQELNIIVKGDVDGSVEALSDSLIKQSTEEIRVNVIHKAVGQVTESDVMLASASDAIIIGFQVRPSVGARRLAETEGIDIRAYSIIYDAINDLKDAMAGMLSPEIKEVVLGSCEIREVFKISKVGTVAGCFVIDGKITRNSKIRIIRDGIVVFTGTLGSLKRFKDDVKEVQKNFECGLNIHNFNDLKVSDVIEAFDEIEIARKL